ncbi:unnamed protein product [Cylicocyclus nassatus]|uniref:Acyltransferase 3 domain-containing protein n=1 Tax=Cylicocyclus nassatus TaxID=53992 RepID=A0AA36H9N2_CYLNA|nr:unnamed protein product [Cylicocyclus nassatus]
MPMGVSETSPWIRSFITNTLLVALLALVIINPKWLTNEVARLCATFIAGTVIFPDANVYILTNSYILYCGDISYVLYLVHWPVIVAERYCWDLNTLNLTGKDFFTGEF